MIKPLTADDDSLDERYGAAWPRDGNDPAPSAADFLAKYPDASPEQRLDVLLTDQLLRWRRGCPKAVAEYLAEYRALTADPDAIVKLVQGEFLARLERDETPEPAFYMRMFPELADEIRSQCEVDQWLTISSEAGHSLSATLDYRSDLGDAGVEAGGHRSQWPVPCERPAEEDTPLREADFQLLRLLGAGGMGEVYEAVQKSLLKHVALKLIKREALESPSRVRRFLGEARALARLRHRHIVGVHGIGLMVDGRYFLVMDLVEGGMTLSSLIQAGAVPFDRAADLVATVALALDHAHSRGVVHRDLKPSNVLLDAEGTPHVTDFGLAKVFDATDPDQPQTTADSVLGTPHYMAPEQADAARGPITPRTDVYGLGGLLYALLTGKPPIQGDSITALLTRLVSPEPVQPPCELRADIPPALERICLNCLEKSARNRYESAAAVATALRSWMANPEQDVDDTVAMSPEDKDEAAAGRRLTSGRSRNDEHAAPHPERRATPRSQGRLLLAGALATTALLACVLVAPRVFRERFTAPAGSERESPATPAPPIAEQAANFIADWDVHLYRPEPDGKTWLALGSALESNQVAKAGDRLKLTARFAEPMFAAVLAINPNGSVQRLGLGQKAAADQPILTLTVPANVDRYITLTDPGPTAFVLLVSHTPRVDLAGIVTRALDQAAWRTIHPEAAWTFDGQVVAPILKTRVAEESVGPRPFAAMCDSLKADALGIAVRAVVFDVK